MKRSLEELLVLLATLQEEEETHGKALLENLSMVFDAELSPDTVYPRLHDLADGGVFEVCELVRTKEYHVADAAAARSRLEAARRQHLALALILWSGLDRL